MPVAVGDTGTVIGHGCRAKPVGNGEPEASPGLFVLVDLDPLVPRRSTCERLDVRILDACDRGVGHVDPPFVVHRHQREPQRGGLVTAGIAEAFEVVLRRHPWHLVERYRLAHPSL